LGQRIGPISKGLEVQEELEFLLKDGADTLFGNVGKGLQLDAA
jgi:hypothetical protein